MATRRVFKSPRAFTSCAFACLSPRPDHVFAVTDSGALRKPKFLVQVMSQTQQYRNGHFKNLIRTRAEKKYPQLARPPVQASKLETLFHPLFRSPFKDLQQRGEVISKVGSCPVCVAEHPKEVDIGKRRQPLFSCPDCGYPTHCNEKHYQSGFEEHKQICAVLRQINEDEHDMRSGRTLTEFDLPVVHSQENLVNFTSWETYVLTREIDAFDETENIDGRPLRNFSKLLTFPTTMSTLLYRYNPFTALLTWEGKKSMLALGKALNDAPVVSAQIARYREVEPKETVRVFVVNPKSGESVIPPIAWTQLQLIIPKPNFQIHFVGPNIEVSDRLPNNRVQSISPQLSLHFHKTDWVDHAELVAPFDLYRDVFFIFHPGWGHPSVHDYMRQVLAHLLETKCPVFCTAFNEEDLERDVKSLQEDDIVEDIDWLLYPTVNPFRELRFEYDPRDLRNLAQKNWSLYGIRGKRFEVTYAKGHEVHQLS